MTISLPGSKKRGLSALLGRKKTPDAKPAARKQLEPEQVARLFKKGEAPTSVATPAKLNASEKKERDSLSTLRGVLYSKR